MSKTLRMISIVTLRVLEYIYDNGGKIIGFRDTAANLHISYQTLKSALKDLEYTGLIERKVGPNNIMIIRLTEKGRKAAELLKRLVEVLEG